MRAQSIEFKGFASDETDFAQRYARYHPGSAERAELDAAVADIAGIVDAGSTGSSFVAIAIVGFSDRNDSAALSCDDRRRSESNASLTRADSAFAWLKDAVTAQLTTSWSDWPNDSDRVTWIMVPTGAAVLAHDPPANEAHRAENRRVKFVFSFFWG